MMDLLGDPIISAGLGRAGISANSPTFLELQASYFSKVISPTLEIRPLKQADFASSLGTLMSHPLTLLMT